MSNFREQNSLEKRLALSKLIRDKHPDRVPVLLTIAKSNSHSKNQLLPQPKNEKILVPTDYTIGKMMFQIRSQLNLRPDTALFLFVGKGILPPTGALVGTIYDRFKDEDQFLYITVASEATFGQ